MLDRRLSQLLLVGEEERRNLRHRGVGASALPAEWRGLLVKGTPPTSRTDLLAKRVHNRARDRGLGGRERA